MEARPFSLPYAFVKQQGVLLVGAEGGVAEVLLREDAGPAAIAEVRRHLGLPLSIAGVVGRSAFDARVGELYASGENRAAEVVEDVGHDADLLQLMQELPPVADLLESRDDAPIIRLVNALFTQAVHERVSDIHIEAYERHSVVRFRRDGMLREVAHPHRALHAAMASRIKVMASLDIAERRMPQDGRIALRLGGRSVDVRVSTIPATHGERVVLRLLDKDNANLRLEALGMPEHVHARLTALLSQPHGMVLVTGPTGSGKTTTLYGALQALDRHSRNILTVEDPVEYDLPGIGQLQINTRIELDFARALRAILRQDPDVVMIGEIRDVETAQIAVQASLTGHLVLATLHTNDAAAAITRLVDLGVESFLLASCLRGVLAQRLVRRLCTGCRSAHPPTAGARAILGAATPATLWSATGCAACSQTGYLGRTGIFELIEADATLCRLVHDGAGEAAVREHARTRGALSLRESGAQLVADGTTSLEELLQVTRD